MPFVTEYLYLHLPFITDESIMISEWPNHLHLPFITDESIMISEWPNPVPAYQNTYALKDFAIIQELVVFVRQTRSHYQVGPKKPIDIYLDTSHERVISQNYKILEEFIHPKLFSMNTGYTPNPEDIVHVGQGFTAYVPLGSLVDIGQEIAKQEAELSRIEGEIKRAEGMLSNPKFIEKAPQDKIDAETQKKANYETQKADLIALLKQLKGHV